jgi:hypothetical protein
MKLARSLEVEAKGPFDLLSDRLGFLKMKRSIM